MLANEMRDNVFVQYEKITANAAPGIQDAQMSIILTNAQLHFIQTRINPLLNIKKEGLEETEVRAQGLSALVATGIVNSFSTTADSLPNSVFAELPLNFMYAILERVYIDKLDCSIYPDSLFKGEYSNTTTYQLNEIVISNGTFYQSLTNNNNYALNSTGRWKPFKGADLVVKVISHDEFKRNTLNPFKRPYYNGTEGLVWRLAYTRNNTAYNAQTNTASNGYEFPTGVTGKLHELVTDGTFSVTEYYVRYLRLPRNIICGNTQQNCELDESTHQAIVNIAVEMLKEALNQPEQQIIPSMQQIE